jgi:hypothetical protein
MSQQDDQLKKIVASIIVAHQDDPMDCETCSRELDCLAERVAVGAKLSDLLPEVEYHLNCCQDCREEFEALVAILKAELSGEITHSS